MFKVTDAMLADWQAKAKPKASSADIQKIEQSLRIKLPQPYIDFVEQYGFVVFGRDADRRHLFRCRYTATGQTVERSGDIAFLETPDNLILAYRNLTEPEYDGDETLPAFPKEYIPVGNDAGQGQILLEMSPQHGRVWYWKEKEWRWGTEDNTELGFVADNFYDFINNLQADPL